MREGNLRKGPWSEEEDERLKAFIALLGGRQWDSLARASGLRRSGKSCRLRWLNYLRPNLKHSSISAEEEEIILQLHQRWGNKWSRIAKRLPGRTDNEIKNYWRTHLRKKIQIQETYASAASAETYSSDKTTNSESDFSSVKGGMISRENSYTDEEIIEDKFVLEDGSSRAPDALPGPAFASSPFENRVFDWMSGLSRDQNEVPCSCWERNGFEFFSGYPNWSPEEGDLNTWDCSCSLWDVDLFAL
ncbi:hypothetical protein Ancab_014518 [Ancistrocladus abbreviatus]